CGTGALPAHCRMAAEQTPAGSLRAVLSERIAIPRHCSRSLKHRSTTLRSRQRGRCQMLSRMCALDVRVSVWIVKQRPDEAARPPSLGALTEEAVRAGAAQLQSPDPGLIARIRQNPRFPGGFHL